MILKCVKWFCSLFGYELIRWQEKSDLDKTIHSYRELIYSTCFYPYSVDFAIQGYQVVRIGFKGAIVVKVFNVKDYGSKEYAYACAQDLCDKLNEKP